MTQEKLMIVFLRELFLIVHFWCSFLLLPIIIIIVCKCFIMTEAFLEAKKLIRKKVIDC